MFLKDRSDVCVSKCIEGIGREVGDKGFSPWEGKRVWLPEHRSAREERAYTSI